MIKSLIRYIENEQFARKAKKIALRHLSSEEKAKIRLEEFLKKMGLER